MIYKDKSQVRATFEDVKRRQNELRLRLDELIEKNIPIGSGDRDVFFNLLSDSTFGLGTREFKFWLCDGKILEIPNLEEFVCALFYYDKSLVDGGFFFKTLGKYRDYCVDIGNLWEQIRLRLGGIMGEAKAMSVRISKEQTQKEKFVKNISTVKRYDRNG